MKKKKSVTMSQIILGSILFAGIVLYAAAIFSKEKKGAEDSPKDYESMTVGQLQKKLDSLIAKDTSEAYLEATKVRDVLKRKNAAQKKQYT